MPLTGNWLLVQRLLTTTLYKLLRLVFITVQRIYWELNGTARKLREARLPQNYNRSAQVLDVVMFHKFCLGQMTTLDNFLCTHNRFEDPQYIIDNDITLMTITEHEAVFCEPEVIGMPLWKSQYGTFIRYAQNDYCKRLIVVPLSTFHRMAEVLGDPKGEVIFLFNTGRCGSTLLTQMLEYTGRCITVSEPNTPFIVAMKYRKSGDSPELRELARDVVRWECRPYSSMQPPPLGYLLKMTAPGIVGLPLFRSLFPSSRCLFMYRDMVKVAQSVYRQSMVFPTFRIFMLLGYLSKHMTRILVDQIGCPGDDYCVRLEDDLSAGIFGTALLSASYLDMRRNGYDVGALRYEDLVARPLEMSRVLLEFCHLPASLAELGLKAFDLDSQKQSILSLSMLGRFKTPQVTAQNRAKLNELMKMHGMPLIGEECIFEGTLSHSSCPSSSN